MIRINGWISSCRVLKKKKKKLTWPLVTWVYICAGDSCYGFDASSHGSRPVFSSLSCHHGLHRHSPVASPAHCKWDPPRTLHVCLQARPGPYHCLLWSQVSARMFLGGGRRGRRGRELGICVWGTQGGEVTLLERYLTQRTALSFPPMLKPDCRLTAELEIKLTVCSPWMLPSFETAHHISSSSPLPERGNVGIHHAPHMSHEPHAFVTC